MLSERDKKRLIRALDKQGADIKRTKSGWRISTSQGIIGTHFSAASDRNADRKLRRDIERIGLRWPFGS